jgi:uncharacterized protein (TIRG00374 family)
MKKKILLLFLRLAISIGLIAYFVNSLAMKHGGTGSAFRQFTRAFSEAPIEWLIPAGFLHIVGFCLLSLRWKILLRGQDVNAPFANLFAYYVMAAFFNNFLPSTIGGDTVRVIESKKMTGSTTSSVMVVLIERLTGMMALVLIAAVGLLISFFGIDHPNALAWVVLGLAIMVFLTIFFFAHPKIAPRVLKVTGKIMPEKIQSFFTRAHAAVTVYYKRPGILLSAQGVSVILQMNIVFYFFLIAKALHQDPDPLEFMVKVPVVIFLLMTVPAINGIGVRTAGFKGLLGFAPVYALAVESIDIVFRIGYGLIGGLVFLFYKRDRS